MSNREISVSKRIHASQQTVWAVLANYARDSEWRQGVEMRQEPPGMAVTGALTYEQLRFLGQTMRVVARIEEVEPGKRLVFQTIESDVPVRGERRVEALDDETTLVAVNLSLRPSGVWALFAAPLAALLKRRFTRDLETLAAQLEARAPVASSRSSRAWAAGART